jgi:hypothetical protein
MRAGFIVGVAVVLTLLPFELKPAQAQSPGGAFDRLSPGNQRIARSLFDAQRRDLPPQRRLSLDQISAKKGSEGWGNVFKDMKSQGLVTEKNLGQIVDRPRVVAKAPNVPNVPNTPNVPNVPRAEHVAPPSPGGGPVPGGGGHGRGK